MKTIKITQGEFNYLSRDNPTDYHYTFIYGDIFATYKNDSYIRGVNVYRTKHMFDYLFGTQTMGASVGKIFNLKTK